MSEIVNVAGVPGRTVQLMSRFEAASGNDKNPPSVPSISGQFAPRCWEGEDTGGDAEK